MSRFVRVGLALVMVVWLVGGEAALAQEPQQKEPTPEEVQAMMQRTMIPMMGEMMNVMMKSMARTLSEPQIAEHFAAFARNYYQALIARGFSQEEAIRIVTATGIPSASGPQQ